MPSKQRGQPFSPFRALRKLLLSTFVVFTFAIYALHERLSTESDGGVIPTEITLDTDPGSTPIAMVPTPTATVPTATVPPTNTPLPSATPVPATNTVPATSKAIAPTVVVAMAASDTPVRPTNTLVPTDTLIPTNTPVPPTATSDGLYRNGKYTGDVADAFYGNVQVRVTISSGKISAVQFLNYPHDRRTSVAINSYAVPYLKTEAIRAQSASVDLVSGATLTSQAFIESLRTALAKAQ